MQSSGIRRTSQSALPAMSSCPMPAPRRCSTSPHEPVTITALPSANHLAVVAGLGFYSAYLIDGLPATGQTAELNSPSDIAVTKSGDLLISNTYSNCIREVPSAAGQEFGVNVTPGTCTRLRERF